MKHLWPDILARPHVRAFLGDAAQPEAPHKAWPIPARVGHMPLARGRVLFVGDAAAASDPMTGEGIGQALATGTWAAEAVLTLGGGSPERVRAAYERRVRRDLLPDHRMSTFLIRALRHRKGARTAIWLASRGAWTRRHFARWLFEDYPRGMLVTPGRWHRGMFTGPGAFADDSTAGNVPATVRP
jgi:flavin-dependent dehydrogenase